VLTGTPVTAVTTAGGRATGVRLDDGTTLGARRAVLADVPAPTLYRDLLSGHPLPAKLHRDLENFQWDHATVKVNWALDRPVPWKAEAAKGAGTVHLGVDQDGFVTTSDPTRSPRGTESAWAYTHVPQGRDWSAERVADHVERVEEAVERVAPGFRDTQVARHVQAPGDLEAQNPSLVGGAINAGTAGLHQQLVFRPTPGLGRPETPVPGLYLASASAHPGGGVHGACGWNAARAALGAGGRLTGGVRRALSRTAWDRVLRAE
jgi:phytoene dehydrogenase-like protein